jgi:GR25 family glycosyltransferase involved in LPS biosynthesis
VLRRRMQLSENAPSTLKTYVINLDASTARWENISAALAKTEFTNVERVSAVIGKNIEDMELAGVSLHTRYLIRTQADRCSHEQVSTMGTIGCTLSHVKCLEIFLETDQPACFICEDDFTFVPQTTIAMRQMISELPSTDNFDILSVANLSTWNNCEKFQESSVLKTCDHLMGTQFYLITRRGASRLLQYMFPIEMHIDAMISLLNIEKKLDVIISSKNLAIHRPVASDAGHTVTWKAYLPDWCIPVGVVTMIILAVLCIVLAKKQGRLHSIRQRHD